MKSTKAISRCIQYGFLWQDITGKPIKYSYKWAILFNIEMCPKDLAIDFVCALALALHLCAFLSTTWAQQWIFLFMPSMDEHRITEIWEKGHHKTSIELPTVTES